MMNRTHRAEAGLRPALSPNETTAGQLARTYAELGNRELSAIRWEMSCPVGAVRERAEDAAGMAGAKALPMRVTAGQGRSHGTAGLLWSPAYLAAIP